MSQSNQTNSESQSQNNQGKKNNSIIYWVIILVLLAGCLYLFMSKNKMAQDNDIASKMQKTQIDSVNTVRDSLQKQFDALSVQIDMMKTQSAHQDSLLASDKEAMQKLKGQIAKILAKKNATDAELKDAREMIGNLTDQSKKYEARIAELEKENAALTGKVQVVTKERDSTVSKNIALHKIGSVLHASNLRMDPIHIKNNGKEKETKKAKKVDVLRIKFDIDENRIAESGTKQIYIRLIAPDGSIMGNPTNGSGMMNLNNGGKLGYSVVKDIALTQAQVVKDVTIDWHQEGDYQKGDYQIEIYNEGFKVGSGKVSLK